MDNFKIFCNKYGGAILGFAVGLVLAILLFCTNLYKFVIVCIYLGNYFQRNKETVKEKLRKLIDRL